MGEPVTTRFLKPFDPVDRPVFEQAWSVLSGDLPANSDPLKTNINLVWASEKLYLARGGKPPVFALIEENGIPLGLLPLRVHIDAKLGGKFVAIHEHPARLSGAGVLVKKGELDRVVTAMVRDARKKWRATSGFYLEGLEPSSALYSALVEAVGPFRMIARTPKREYYIDLSDCTTVEDFSRAKSRNYRKNVSRGLKRLSEDGGYEYHRALPGEQNSFDQLAEIDRQTWRAREREGDLPATLIEFCRGLQNGIGDVAEGRIEAIEFNGKPIAMLYSLQVGDRLYGLKHTFDPEYTSYQPVMVLMQHTIEEAINNDVRYIEMLTGSTHATTWAANAHDLSQDVVYFASPLGYASLATMRLLRALKGLRETLKAKQKGEVQA